MENFSRTGEYLERLRKVSLNSDVWFANPLEGKDDFLGNLKDEPENGPMDYASYRSSLLNGWKDGQKNKEEYDSQLMPSFSGSDYSVSGLSTLSVQKVVFPESETENFSVAQYGETPIQPVRDVRTFETSRFIEPLNEAPRAQVPVQHQAPNQAQFQTQNPVQAQAQPQPLDSAQNQTQNQARVSAPAHVRNNPFAKMTQKEPMTCASGAMKEFQNFNGWFTSGRCFGILGVTVGGVLTAFSVLSSAGSHPMTALGISLISAGIFMFASVGILSAFQNVKERV